MSPHEGLARQNRVAWLARGGPIYNPAHEMATESMPADRTNWSAQAAATVNCSSLIEKTIAQTPPESNQDAALILQHPGDVLLLVSDHLDVASQVSLALTCRTAFAFCFSPRKHKALSAADKKDLLQLLERDPLMRGRFYCHTCNVLHPFKPSWGPHSLCEREEKTADIYHCGRRDRFAPAGNDFGLSYVHARLVMNRHLYGPDHGIPLENICVEQTFTREPATVRCATTARIIDDELYIRRAYDFAIPADHASVDAFRRCTGARDFRVCEHTSLFSNSSFYRQCIPEIQRRPTSSSGSSSCGSSCASSPNSTPSSSPPTALAASPPVGACVCFSSESAVDGGSPGFVPCDDAQGSCGLCLMDFDVTIREPDDADTAEWRVTIRAYHQLGPCRSPDDWRWARFSESSRPHLFFPNRPNRRGSSEFPGAARKRWFDNGGPGPDPDPQVRARQVPEPEAVIPPSHEMDFEMDPEPVDVGFRGVNWTTDDSMGDTTDDDRPDDADWHSNLRLGTIMNSVPLGSSSVSPTNNDAPWQPPSSPTTTSAETATATPNAQPRTTPASPVAAPPWLWTQLGYPYEWGVL